MDESIALYVHFPYCLSICSYCDFDRQATGFSAIPRYVRALSQEIAQQRAARVHSVYFGGGTPSLMEPAEVDDVLRAVDRRFALAARCEITIEANPSECETGRLAGFRAAGVNRLSIGVQSLDDGVLAGLGRRHTGAEAVAAVRAARAAGFRSVSLDLMLGLPGMTRESWNETLDGVLGLEPDHLSCYVLTIDERVPLGRDVVRGRVRLPDDDAVADQYVAARERLERAGFRQYEISNWARPGFESRHNLTYWRDGSYLGIGAGAAGWIEGIRYKNHPSPRRYMASVARGAAERIEEERPDPLVQMRDFLALGLRLREGVDRERFRARFGLDLDEVIGAASGDLERAGVLERTPTGWRVAERSILVTNEIVLRLDDAFSRWVAARLPGSVAKEVAEGEQRAARADP